MDRANQRKESVQDKKYPEKLCPIRTPLLLGMHGLAVYGLTLFSFEALFFFLGFYFLTGCLGLTVGYHRLLTHRSFVAPKWLKNSLSLLGTMCMQGSPTLWVAYHRMHHTNTDHPGDPHSSKRGFLWSHFYWMIHRAPNGFSLRETLPKVRDVADTKFIRFLDRHYFFVNLCLMLLFYLTTRRLDLTLWAFPVRIVAFWHATWLVNSYAHHAGSPNKEVGSSRNSFWLSLIMFGEGWHLNHHQFPGRATFQSKSWHLDMGYHCIQAFEFLGIANKVRKLDYPRKEGFEEAS